VDSASTITAFAGSCMEEIGEREENDESTDDHIKRCVAKSSLSDLSIAASPRCEEAKPTPAGTSSQGLTHMHN